MKTSQHSHEYRTTGTRKSRKCEQFLTIWRENKTKRHSWECRESLSHECLTTVEQISRDSRKNKNQTKWHRVKVVRHSYECLTDVSDCRTSVSRLSRDSCEHICNIKSKFAKSSRTCPLSGQVLHTPGPEMCPGMCTCCFTLKKAHLIICPMFIRASNFGTRSMKYEAKWQICILYGPKISGQS